MPRVLDPKCLYLQGELTKSYKCWHKLAPIETRDEAPIVALVGTVKLPGKSCQCSFSYKQIFYFLGCEYLIQYTNEQSALEEL